MFLNIQNEENKERIYLKNFIFEIKQLEQKILENDFFEDFDKKKINFLVEIQNPKINIQFQKDIIEQIQKINDEYQENIKNIKKKLQQISKKQKKIINKEDIISTKKDITYSSFHNDFYKKNKTYLEFKSIIQKIDEDFENYLKKILILGKKSVLEQEQQEKIFVNQNKEVSNKISEKKEKIKNFFYQKSVLLNEKIRKLKLNYKEKIVIIDNKYEDIIQQIQQDKKEEDLLNLYIKNINNHLENDLNYHNKILIQQQEEFNKQKQDLEKEQNNLFIQEKLRIFFNFKQVNKKNYYNYKNFIKKKIQIEFSNFKKKYFWRKKYIFLKYFYNQKINLISIEKKKIIQMKQAQIETNISFQNQEKNIFKNILLQQLNDIELEFRLIEIDRKYSIIELNSEEDQSKSSILFLFQKSEILEKLKIENLKYQKKMLFLNNKHEKKKCLLKMQIKIEKINLKSFYFENIIKKNEKIKELKNQKIYLKNNQESQIQKQIIICEQNKYDFLKREKLIKVQFKYLVEQYFENYQKNLNDLNLFSEYMNNIKKKIKVYLKILN